MNNEKDFQPVLRFMTLSDIHVKDEHTVEEDRLVKAVQTAARLAREDEAYQRLDALVIVGDFANSGSEIQMEKVKKAVYDNIPAETQVSVSLASHEYSTQNGGEEAALERFKRIFGLPCDDHRVINGFHFINITSTKGCNYDEPKQQWAAEQLKIAAADDPKKPIFFFQHPHITDTVAGSIYWADDALIPYMVSYPQIIDFSGHSHVPVNDPRSIHQRHFTCLGTGTLSYFELDEFDKYYSTCPPQKEKAAQFLIVEADAAGRVRVYPYDLITDRFFAKRWAIDTPWEPDSFCYTDDRMRTANKPYFDGNARISAEVKGNGVTVTFDQAKDDEEGFVDDYVVTVRNKDNVVVSRKCLWSEYYFNDMPASLAVPFEDLAAGEYTVQVFARSFWRVRSANTLQAPFTV